MSKIGLRSPMGIRLTFRGRMAALLGCFTVLLLAGCGQFFPPNSNNGGGGGGGGGTPSGDYLYVGNLNSSNLGVAAFTFNTATLSSLASTPYSTGVAAPFALAVTPNNKFLYVGGGTTQSIAYFPINSNGTLGNIALAGSFSPAALSVDTTGNWLIGIDALYNQVYSFQLNTSAGGFLQTYSSSAVTLPNCNVSTDMAGLNPAIAITSNDNYVYASCGTAGIYALTFNSSNGALNLIGNVVPAKANGADSGMAIATRASGNRYLLAAETVTNGVRVFSIDSSTGHITQVSGSPFPTGNGPSAVLVDASNDYVYVANRAAGTISGFTLETGGKLAAVAGSPFGTGSLPVAMVEDNTHTYIAAVCSGGNADLNTYTIGSTGALVSFKNAATGTDPTLASSIAATH